MPKWLHGMVAPTLMLWLCALAISVAESGSETGELPKRAELASALASPLVIAFWVTADARKRRRQLCYDYDSFLFFAWPLIAPVYLFQTRGARAFLTILWFAAIWLVATLAGFAVSIVREWF